MTLILTAYGLAALALDRYGRRRTGTASAVWDGIVVAGCHVRPDGQPTASLAQRVRRAVELFHAGTAPVLVLTGGVGTHEPAEAVAAARLARSLGVPDEAIVLEDRSGSTEENARFAREIFGGRRVIVVTDTYHLYRTERVFRRYFDEVMGVAAISPMPSRVAGSLREVSALLWYSLTGRLAPTKER